MNKSNITLGLAITALLIALIFIGTYAIQVPMPFSQGGLIHAGDLVFFTVCLLFRPKRSSIAGAFGMGLFDLLSPYAIWAPFTFVIRLIMGFAISSVAGQGDKISRNLLALLVGLPILIGGYYAAEAILYGNWIAPVKSITGNFSQWLIGAAGSIPLSRILYNIPALKNMR